VLTSWDVLKTFSSKPLIRFVEPKSGVELIVCILSPRHNMKIKEMLEGRSGFWKLYHEQAQVVSHPEEMVNDRPTGWIEVTIPGSGESDSGRRICEAIIQQDPGRYFSLLWSVKGGAALEFPSEANHLVGRNLSCPHEDVLKQRWNQARKHAQQFLESIRPKMLKSDLQKDHWFRIAYNGQDVGFHYMRQQAWKTEEKKFIEIDTYDSFSGDVAMSYLQSLGLYPSAGDDESAQSWISRITTVRGKTILEDNCKSETNEIRYFHGEESSPLFQETTRWSSGQIEITRQQSGSADSYAETLKVKNSMYLGEGLWNLFGRLGEIKPNQEFLFYHYHHGQLDYCYIRAGTPVASPVRGVHEKEEKPASVDSAGAGSEAGQCLYLTAKMGLSGPVMELWIDTKGDVVQWRCNGFVGIRDVESTIRSRWPAEADRMHF